jgi:hypothetical protein
MAASMNCIPWGWVLKYLETSTAPPVVLCGFSHIAVGTQLPWNPPGRVPTKWSAPSTPEMLHSRMAKM